MQPTIKAALAGNPNCGKSTIFNRLTGAKQSVRNFPGVTVERYEGRATRNGRDVSIVDLPGTYSVSAYSDEERVASEYLKNEKPDVVVNVVDASNLERNLYLTLSLKELGRPMLVVLNMIDVAKRRGFEIDARRLSAELGLPVLETVGNRGVGTKEILDEIIRLADAAKEAESQKSASEEASDAEVETNENGRSAAPQGRRRRCCGSCSGSCSGCVCRSERALQTSEDVARYKEISRICARCVQSATSAGSTFSDRVDALATNRFLGLPFFLLAMYLVFQLTFTVGQYPMDWIEAGFAALADFLDARLADGFLKSLLVDGVIGGVGGVLVFLPNIFFLFLAISVLEDSGYMARAALLTDRWMHKIGLHGRSVVPLLVGFGCTVPALSSTKMLTDKKERLATMFVLPLFSCGARFPIYALLIPAFFPLQWRGPILCAIYLIGVSLAIVVAKTFSFAFRKEEDAPFVVELPPYHLPTFRTVGVQTLQRCWLYAKKAGTTILGISVALWFLTSYPNLSPERRAEFDAARATATAENANDPAALEAKLAEIDAAQLGERATNSFAGRVGRFIEPGLRPMGFDWRIGTALIGAFAAKEVFVAQMGVVYSIGEADETSTALADSLASHYSPLVGFCVMLFCLIATPCAATFVTMARESGSWGWAAAQWGVLTGIAWVLTTLVYQIGRLFAA